jgi:RND family efflux transporter MFP subunit
MPTEPTLALSARAPIALAAIASAIRSTRARLAGSPAPGRPSRGVRATLGRGRIAPLALLALLAGAGCSESVHPEPGEPPPAVQARTAIAERREVGARVELQGTVEAERKSSLAARVMAVVAEVLVEEGERVGAGQTLLTLDPGSAEAQVAQARGALAQAEAALVLARRNQERFAALAAGDAASALEADQARTQLAQAEGAVEQARGALEAASDIAGDTRVAAPFAARVAERLVDPGDLAAPGRPLLVLESEASRRLVLAVPEGLLARAALAIGQSLTVALDALPESGTMEGAVALIGAGADPATHAVRVEVLLPTDEVASGAAGRAWLPVGRRDAVLVPPDAILRRGGLVRVVLRTEDGTASTRVVTTGGSIDGEVEVLSGLDGGETVLLGLAAPPPSGSPVEVLPEGQ